MKQKPFIISVWFDELQELFTTGNVLLHSRTLPSPPPEKPIPVSRHSPFPFLLALGSLLSIYGFTYFG